MLLTYSAVTFAESEATKEIPLHLELSLSTETPNKGIMPFGTEIDLNYGIRRFSIHAISAANFFHPKDGQCKNYNRAVNLGGGLGFELFSRDESNSNVFEIRASVTTTVGSAEYKNTAYKIGLEWYKASSKRKINPVVGVGYCLRDFSGNGKPSYSGAYLSFGLRF